MISTKCDKCKYKAWCWSCDECQSKQLVCFVCDKIITNRERRSHRSAHFNDPYRNLVCRKCKVIKQISYFKFNHYTCRLCLYLNRFRFRQIKERFIEYARKHNFEVKP